MLQSDVNRRCVCFDRPVGQGNGIVGTVICVYDDSRFRLRTDPSDRYPEGREHELTTAGDMAVNVQFLEAVK